MAEQIVLFGGTFDPIHNGHLIVARAIAEHFGFPKVTFVPAGAPPHKTAGNHRAGNVTMPAHRPPVASAEHRLEMVRLAIAGEERLAVSDVELRRNAPSFTFDTLSQIRQESGPAAQLFWIVGADMLADLPAWHRATEVVKMATIVTAGRTGHDFGQTQYNLLGGKLTEALRNAFGQEQLDKLTAWIAPTPLVDISSTQIRFRLRQKLSVRFLVPEAVVEYVRCHSLYDI